MGIHMPIFLKDLLSEDTINEATKLSISAVPGIDEEDVKEGEHYLRKFYAKRGTSNFLTHYDWELRKVRGYKEGMDGKSFDFSYLHKGGKKVEEPRWPGSEYTRTVKKFRGSSRSVDIKDVPEDSRFAYRGMSMAEWADAKGNGKIQSQGGYNIGTQQENWTFFSNSFRTAAHYSSGFAPFDREATRKEPAVIIAVPIELTKNAKDVGAGTEDERVAREVPLNQVKHLWVYTPIEFDTGHIDIVVNRDYKGNESVSDGSRAGPISRKELIQIK